jgi:hypothetical protein
LEARSSEGLRSVELARVSFETDGDWREALNKPRPEYVLPRGVRIEAGTAGIPKKAMSRS